MRNVILLNNLFNGKYIQDKIGGEIINMYQSDNGRYYVYVNPYGNIASKWDNKVEYILFIRTTGNGIVKIIGKSKVKEQISLNAVKKLDEGCDSYQKEYIDKNGINYDGIPVYKLGSWSNYFVTFEVDGIYKPKRNIYLTTNKKDEDRKENIFYLDGVNKINNQSQKLYIEKDNRNYDIINDHIINNSELWESEKVGKIRTSDYKSNSCRSFLSIIKKENDELVNSNLLAHFLENDLKFWGDFVKKVLKISDDKILNVKPKITRESLGNIDLLIEVDNYVFVIENKIKSGINGRKSNGYSQLEKYYEKTTDYINGTSKKAYFYLLRPDYNNENYKDFNMSDKYKEIKYSAIYNIIKNRNGNLYFEEFKKVVKKHSSEYDNELFEIMNDRFIEQIKSIKSNLL